jgi:hypothetical protein
MSVMVALSVAIVPAFAMGPPGSDCTNRYDGKVVSLIINNGTSTIDLVRDNVTEFNASTSEGYNATVTIEFPAASSEDNSEPGQYWMWTDAYGIRYGDCQDGATAGGKVVSTFEVREDDLYPNSVLTPYYLDGGVQKVGIVTHWDGNVDANQDAAYNVTWIADSNGTDTSQNNSAAPQDQPEQPDEDQPATQLPTTTTNNNVNQSIQQSTKTTVTNKITVNKPITITNVENNNVVINNVKVNQQVKLSTEVSAPETQTAAEPQPVVVLIEIRDGEGYTIFLESRNNVVVEESEPVQLVWTPSEPGSYQTRVFTVDDLQNPSAFSFVSVSQFSVSG